LVTFVSLIISYRHISLSISTTPVSSLINHRKLYLITFCDRKPKKDTAESSSACRGRHDCRSSENADITDEPTSTGLPFSATVDPLLVHIAPHPPRPPTLPECQAIVKHLYATGSQHAREVGTVLSPK